MHFTHKIFLFGIILLRYQVSIGQKLPAQQLHLFDLTEYNQNYTLSHARYLSAFNPNGYTNQPNFFSDQEVWLTAQLPSDTLQTEIIALNLELSTFTRITDTRLSEYSPTPMPNGTEWSAVVVEADGVQRLRAFPKVGGGAGKLLLPKIEGVGYHAWLSDSDLALFIVGEPHTLVHARVKGQKTTLIGSNIGRCLARHPKNGMLFYVSKATESTWFIKSYNHSTQQQEIVCQTLPHSEDFTFLPDGQLLMAQGSKLYVHNTITWKEIFDFTPFGLQNITRLAYKNGKLIVVSD